jgi:hypothetical protein
MPTAFIDIDENTRNPTSDCAHRLTVHILDYKPDAPTNKPIAQLAIYALALTCRIPGLKLFDIKCAWFNEVPISGVFSENPLRQTPGGDHAFEKLSIVQNVFRSPLTPNLLIWRALSTSVGSAMIRLHIFPQLGSFQLFV